MQRAAAGRWGSVGSPAGPSRSRAGIVLALVATQLLVVGPRDERIAEQGEDVNALAKAAAWSLAIQGGTDAERVELASTTGDASVTGTLVYSPDDRPSRRPCAGTRATAGRDGVPLLGGEWGRADADRQDVLCRRYRLLGR